MPSSGARVHHHEISNSGSYPGGSILRTSLASQLLYGLGDWIYSLAVVILAYQLSGELAVSAVVLLLQAAGRFIGVRFSPSRCDSRRLYRFAIGFGAARAALIAGLIFLTSEDQLWLVMAVAVALGALSPIGEGAQRALTPIRRPTAQKRSLRSRLICRRDQIAMIAGSVAGGTIIVIWSEQAAFAIASTMSILAIGLVHRASTMAPVRPSGATLADQPREWSQPVNLRTLRVLMLALAAGAALGMAIRILLVEIVIDDYGSSELVYGLFIALAGAGAFAGPISVPRLLGRLPSEIVLAGVTLALGVALITTYVAEPLALIVPIIIGCGVLAITAERTGETVIRRLVPDHELDGALRQVMLVTISGQAVALALIAAMDYLSGVTLVVLCLSLLSIFCAAIPVFMYVGRRSRPTASSGD